MRGIEWGNAVGVAVALLFCCALGVCVYSIPRSLSRESATGPKRAALYLAALLAVLAFVGPAFGNTVAVGVALAVAVLLGIGERVRVSPDRMQILAAQVRRLK